MIFHLRHATIEYAHPPPSIYVMAGVDKPSDPESRFDDNNHMDCFSHFTTIEGLMKAMKDVSADLQMCAKMRVKYENRSQSTKIKMDKIFLDMKNKSQNDLPYLRDKTWPAAENTFKNTLDIITEAYATETVIKRHFQKLKSWVLHSILLKTILLECNVLHKQVLDQEYRDLCAGSENDPLPLAITNRLAYYIHRVEHPIYYKLPKKRTCNKPDAQQKVLQFLWDEDLGTKVTYTFCLKPMSGGVHKRMNRAILVFSTLTCKFISETMTLEKLAELVELLEPFDSRSNLQTVHEGKTLLRLWAWQHVLMRTAPVVPAGAQMCDAIMRTLTGEISTITTALTTKDNNEPNTSLPNCPKSPNCEMPNPTLELVLRRVSEEDDTWNVEPLKDHAGSSFFTFLRSECSRDTLLPVIIEHSEGFRIYPYSRDPLVLEFYAKVGNSSAVDRTLSTLDACLSFLLERESSSVKYTTSTLAALRCFASKDKSNSLHHIPPPVYLRHSILDPDALDFRRMYVRDQSQFSMNVSEHPVLAGDLTHSEPTPNHSILHNVRFTLRVKDLLEKNLYVEPSCQFGKFLVFVCGDNDDDDNDDGTYTEDNVNYMAWGGKIHRAILVENIHLKEMQTPHFQFLVDATVPKGGKMTKKITTCILSSLLSKYIYKYKCALTQLQDYLEIPMCNLPELEPHDDHQHCQSGHSILSEDLGFCCAQTSITEKYQTLLQMDCMMKTYMKDSKTITVLINKSKILLSSDLVNQTTKGSKYTNTIAK